MRDEPESDTKAKDDFAAAIDRTSIKETIPCEPCNSTGSIGKLSGTATCDACRGHGVRYVFRPAAAIMFVPTVVMQCGCGREHSSPAPDMVAMLQAKREVPPIECPCGRVLIGEKKMVVR